MSKFRFTPYSLDAFKRIARDVQRAYPISLQQSQEALARAFGYVDLHALHEHLKTSPSPGASGDGAQFAALTVDANFLNVVHDMHGPHSLVPSGRRSIQDLCITWDPARRREAINFQDEIDRIIEGDLQAELDTPTSDYVAFVDRGISDILLDDEGRPLREGVFVVSEKGDAMRHALRWFDQAIVLAAEREDPDEHASLFMRLGRLLELVPNNPYVLAAWLAYTQFSILNDKGALPNPNDRTAEYTEEVSLVWSLAQECRAMFDALMPPKFRGQIEPRLTGIRIENEAYFNVLYTGALTAAALGHAATAKAWVHRSLDLHPNDSRGARFILDHVKSRALRKVTRFRQSRTSKF